MVESQTWIMNISEQSPRSTTLDLFSYTHLKKAKDNRSILKWTSYKDFKGTSQSYPLIFAFMFVFCKGMHVKTVLMNASYSALLQVTYLLWESGCTAAFNSREQVSDKIGQVDLDGFTRGTFSALEDHEFRQVLHKTLMWQPTHSHSQSNLIAATTAASELKPT